MDGLVLALAGVGACFAGGRVFIAVMRAINYRKFNEVVHKLVKAGDLARAQKLARAVPKATYGPVVLRLLEEAEARSAADGRGLVTDALRETLDRAVADGVRELRRWRWLGWLAAGFAVAAAVVGHLYQAAPIPSLVVPAVVAVMVFAGWRNTNKIERDCRTHGAELVGWLADYVVAGDGAAGQAE
jgi:hypothetical protein